MVKKYGICYFIVYYRIVEFIALGLLFSILNPFIFYFICMALKISSKSILFQIFEILVPGFLVFLWLSLFAFLFRAKRYTYVTDGRNFRKDRRKFNRSYRELVEYFSSEKNQKIDELQLPLTDWKEAEGIILGKTKNNRLFHIPSGTDGKNYFIFGLPASGKTAGPIICSCLRWGMHHPLNVHIPGTDGSIFCIDLKNDIWKVTQRYRCIKRFNLMNPEESCHFNPLAGIEKLSIDERCNFIENMGYNIIPEASGSDGKYFKDTAEDFFNGIALYLLDKDINTSFPTIINAVLSGNAIDWVKRIVSDGSQESKNRLASKWGENEKNLSGGYSLLAQSCRKFSSETLLYLLDNKPDYEYISVQNLEDGYDVYIQLDQADMQNYSALLSLITQTFLNGFLKRENNPRAGRLPNGTLRPIAFILDEFAQLKNMKYESIATAFMTLRSRNISIVCALQSLSSISEMFHSENATKSLVDCVSTFCFLSVQDVETRKWASDLIGTHKVLKLSNTLGHSAQGSQNDGRTVSEAREPIIFPEEFGSLKDVFNNRDEIIIYSNGKYLRANKQYYFK